MLKHFLLAGLVVAAVSCDEEAAAPSLREQTLEQEAQERLEHNLELAHMVKARDAVLSRAADLIINQGLQIIALGDTTSLLVNEVLPHLASHADACCEPVISAPLAEVLVRAKDVAGGFEALEHEVEEFQEAYSALDR